ncbi:MAG: PD-(D/E)XK nuclease family protein, partial [Rikenellaceae bacterium]
YALRETLAYTFVERLIELQHHAREARGGSDVTFYHVDVVGLLSHPYILNEHTGGVINKILCDIEKLRMISVSASTLRGLPLLELIFKRHNSWSAISQYLQDVVGVVVQNLVSDLTVEEEHLEYLDFISSHILTLENSVEACGIELSVEIYISLLRRHLQTLRIPFEGEPLEGLQVMGILESRNLDFRNVIILSMNDDNFPTNQLSKPSFIPYNLRLAYSLPTPEHHEGVYAYYFYRLISRAQSVWMLYSSHAGEMSTGEPSRYIHQLEYESTFPISRVAVGVDVNMVANETIEVEKSGRVAEQLSRFLDVDSPVTLSPTALFRYIACPLRFYLYSLAGVRRDEQISEEVDAPMFGTIFHAAIEKLYEPYVNIVGVGEALKELVSKGSVEEAVECAINDHYLKKECAKLADYSGNLLLVKEIVTKYIKGGVIAYDVANPQFVVRGVECDINDDYEFELGRRVRFKGVIDRLDSLDSGELRVVDYKTGGQHLEFKGIESLFKGAAEQRQSHIIQTLIYSMLLARREPERVIAPALYYVRSMNREGYSPRIVDCSVKPHEELLDYATCGEEFESYMREVLCELFDTSVPFRQCEDREKTCIYCDYASICRGVD